MTTNTNKGDIMGQPGEPTLRHHHGYRSWSSFWYGPDRDEHNQLRRHCKRFGRESTMSRKVAVGEFRRWLTDVWEPKYGRGADSDVLAKPVYTCKQLADDYFAWAQTYHRKDGKAVSIGGCRVAMRVLTRVYGDRDVNTITAPMIATLRDEMLKPNAVGPKGKARTEPLTVKTAREYLAYVKAAFRWGCSERGVVDEKTAGGALLVRNLLPGRCAARDKERVMPVEWERVEAALTHLPENLKAMVMLQWHTGMRPGEVRSVRPCDVTWRAELNCWVYSPHLHKMMHKKRIRKVPIGPEAFKVLEPYLSRQVTLPCFSPREALKQNGRIKSGDAYGGNQYHNLVRNAARKAGVATFSVNQLRHSWATRVAELFGIEAVADGLGHANLNTALIYAEKSLKRASEVARKVG